MSCFWDSLINKIRLNDLKYILNTSNINPLILATKLKEKNLIVKNIIVNKKKITINQQKENFKHIENYNVDTINDGYDCSTFDPFLILICKLLSITINNQYDNNLIIYEPYVYSRYTIFLKNDKGHMQ